MIKPDVSAKSEYYNNNNNNNNNDDDDEWINEWML